MNYRVVFGIGLLMVAMATLVVNATEGSHYVRPVTRENAVALFGGQVNNMCQSPGGITCNTSCQLAIDQCFSCNGSAYTGCIAYTGSNCISTYDNVNKAYCGFYYIGPPMMGKCPSNLCAGKTKSQCGLMPNSTAGGNCP
jgi:hypothetical protein